MIIRCDSFDKRRNQIGVVDSFADKGVEYGSAGVFLLKRGLKVKGFKQVSGVANRQLSRVGVVRVRVAGADDVRVLFAVDLRQAERGAFSRSGFQVVNVTGFFLHVGNLFLHVMKNAQGKFLTFRVAN